MFFYCNLVIWEGYSPPTGGLTIEIGYKGTRTGTRFACADTGLMHSPPTGGLTIEIGYKGTRTGTRKAVAGAGLYLCPAMRGVLFVGIA